MNLKEDIELFAVSAKRFGAKVEINHTLPTVAVTLDDNEYFFQGDEAKQLLADAELMVEAIQDVDPEDVILWLARGW